MKLEKLSMIMRRRRIGWSSTKIVVAASILPLLASCSQSPPNFCATEERVIPEIEWKARALTALQKVGADHIPPAMRQFVERRLSSGDSDTAKRGAFQAYMEKHPLCCQIDYRDRYGRLEVEYDVPSDELMAIAPKATMYVLGGDESEFIELDERDKIKSELRTSKPSSNFDRIPPVWTQAGISSCGDKVAVWDVGGGRYAGR